ncbi:MAG: TolC family protein [Clostridia bacterium]|nr:TolC family protein [Clostridia bacterium]
MIKKISKLLLICIILTSLTVHASQNEVPLQNDEVETAANEALTSAEAEPVVYTLTLADAIAMAAKDSSQLAVCDINKQSLQKQRNDAAGQQRDSKNIPVYMNKNFELMFVKKGYYVSMFDKYILLADDEKAKVYASIAYDTTQKYFTYKNSLALLEAAENGLERAKENLEIINQKYALGMCARLEVTNAEIARDECIANVTQSQHNTDLCKDSLKICLNIEEDCEFILTDEIEVNEFNAELETDTQNALTTRYDVKALKTSSDLAEEYFSITKGLNEDSVTYYSAYADYTESIYNYDNGVKNIKLGIKSSYYNAIDAHGATQIAKQKVEFLKSQYEVSKLQFEMGMITNIVLSSKSDELTAAEIAYNNCLLTEKLAVENYNYQITIGI